MQPVAGNGLEESQLPQTFHNYYTLLKGDSLAGELEVYDSHKLCQETHDLIVTNRDFVSWHVAWKNYSLQIHQQEAHP